MKNKAALSLKVPIVYSLQLQFTIFLQQRQVNEFTKIASYLGAIYKNALRLLQQTHNVNCKIFAYTWTKKLIWSISVNLKVLKDLALGLEFVQPFSFQAHLAISYCFLKLLNISKL